MQFYIFRIMVVYLIDINSWKFIKPLIHLKETQVHKT